MCSSKLLESGVDFDVQRWDEFLVMPTENVRGFTTMEKSIIKTADCLNIVIHELVIVKNRKNSKIVTSLDYSTYSYCNRINAFLEIKFTNMNYNLVVHDDFKELDLYIEIVSIHEDVKKAVEDYCIQK